MKALTLWQPWAWWVASGWKPIENRPWAPPKNVIGTTIAIHAGKTFDTESQDFPAENGIEPPEGFQHDLIRVRSAILGTARIVECVELGQLHPHAALKSPWFFGPFGWILADIRPLAEPVPCKGALGLWTVPNHVESLMRFSA